MTENCQKQQSDCLDKMYSDKCKHEIDQEYLSAKIIEGNISLKQQFAHQVLQKENSYIQEQIHGENICEDDSSEGEFQFASKTNNLIKNILKQFYKFLTKKQNLELVSEIIIEKPSQYSQRIIQRYFDRISYNNLSLIRIIKHQNYGKFLKGCCVNQELISEINFYKKNKSFQQ